MLDCIRLTNQELLEYQGIAESQARLYKHRQDLNRKIIKRARKYQLILRNQKSDTIEIENGWALIRTYSTNVRSEMKKMNKNK